MTLHQRARRQRIPFDRAGEHRVVHAGVEAHATSIVDPIGGAHLAVRGAGFADVGEAHGAVQPVTIGGVTWRRHADPPRVGKIWPDVVVWDDGLWIRFGVLHGHPARG